MGTAIVNYSLAGTSEKLWGVSKRGSIYRINGYYADHRMLMDAYFDDRTAFDRNVDLQPEMSTDVVFNAPVSSDIQLFCQGLNYASHREESGASAEEAEENLIFMKAASSVCGPNEPILRPRGCELLDYEIELGLVLKKGVPAASQVKESDLPEYIGGLMICNDVSARDLMFGSPMLQWFRGKSQRTFCPSGPVLYLMDLPDFELLYTLQLKLWMNDELKQDAITSQLIHRPAETLTELSGFTDVCQGDCLLTGTPGGILAGSSPRAALAILLNFQNDERRRRKFVAAQKARVEFLQPGDRLELQIKSLDGRIDLGRQTSTIANA